MHGGSFQVEMSVFKLKCERVQDAVFKCRSVQVLSVLDEVFKMSVKVFKLKCSNVRKVSPV